jgi:hypothetical protein
MGNKISGLIGSSSVCQVVTSAANPVEDGLLVLGLHRVVSLGKDRTMLGPEL